VLNNPLSFTDKLGLDCDDDNGTWDSNGNVDGGCYPGGGIEGCWWCQEYGWPPSEPSTPYYPPNPPSKPKPPAPPAEPPKNVFVCASKAAGKVSIAGGIQALGLGTSGVGGFITNALGGNAFSGATDLLQSLGSGEGEDHSVFYNMGQSVVAGPTQGFGAIFGSALKGTAAEFALPDIAVL
jgi:hypothetical protein